MQLLRSQLSLALALSPPFAPPNRRMILGSDGVKWMGRGGGSADVGRRFIVVNVANITMCKKIEQYCHSTNYPLSLLRLSRNGLFRHNDDNLNLLLPHFSLASLSLSFI